MPQKAKPNRKSQSALEYMMTYGWAILIIVIVAGVLYSLGIFTPSSSTGTTITGFSDFGVNGQCIQGGALQLQITNGIGYPINVTRINTTGSNGQSVTINTSVLILSSQSQLVFIPGACPASAGSSYSNPVTFTYKEPGQTLSGPYISNGRISGIVSVSTPAQTASFQQSTLQASYIQASDSANFVNGVTVSFWLDPVNNGYWGVSNHWENAVSNNYCGGSFFFFIEAGSNPPVESWSILNSTASQFREFPGVSLTPGVFQQLVGIWNGNHIAVYLNGNLVGTNVSTVGPIQSNGGKVIISGSQPLSANGCNALSGPTSNVQVYNTALSATEIKQLYEEGIGGAPLLNSGLVGWWPLDGNANDYSGNNNNGVATNVSWVSP